MTETAFVDTDWLQRRINDPGIAVIDTREPYFYAQGHIPRAVNLPAIVLATPRGSIPAREPLARRLGQLGVSRESHAIVCDDGASSHAGRLFWLLHHYGHPRISILDGGVTKWRHEGRELAYAQEAVPPVEYVMGDEQRDDLATADDVEAAAHSPDAMVLDVRSPAEYLGLQTTARRDGHVPGALNIDWTTNMERDESGVTHLRSDDELRTMYESAGVTGDKRVVVYCQTGGRSAVTYAVLRKLGYDRVQNYAAGWQEWGNREDTRIEGE